MLHELVLCGVGGRTVEEARRRLTYKEFLSWCRYRAKYGTFNIGMRIDRGIARGVANYFSANSSKTYSIADFSPFDKAIMDNMTIDQQIDAALSHFPRASHAN